LIGLAPSQLQVEKGGDLKSWKEWKNKLDSKILFRFLPVLTFIWAMDIGLSRLEEKTKSFDQKRKIKKYRLFVGFFIFPFSNTD
jgi:hypothetical protein